MLILTRKLSQTICIGDDISITILGVQGNQIKIGVQAPIAIPVHREEIYERIQNEKEGNNW